MSDAYGILKVLHVVAVVVWIGGATALATATARLARAGDRATLAALMPHTVRYGRTMMGPSSLLVLLTGIGMVRVGNIGFEHLWISLGFVAFVVHFGFGLTVMRGRTAALARLLAASPTDDTAIAGAAARVRVANLVYLLVMVATIAVMVLKPTL